MNRYLVPDKYWTPDARFKSGRRLTPEGRLVQEWLNRQQGKSRAAWCAVVLAWILLAFVVGPSTGYGQLSALSTLGFLAFCVYRMCTRSQRPGALPPSLVLQQSDAPASLLMPPQPAALGEVRAREAIPADVRKTVWARDMGRCRHCGIPDPDAVMRTGEHLAYDHVVPFSRNGATTVNNLQLLCGPCNRAKGNTFTG